jgi:hypothetical protein
VCVVAKKKSKKYEVKETIRYIVESFDSKFLFTASDGQQQVTMWLKSWEKLCTLDAGIDIKGLSISTRDQTLFAIQKVSESKFKIKMLSI